MTVFAPLRLARQGLICGETISPAQLGRTLCTEVAEQVPYWVAVLTPAERPLLDARSVSGRREQAAVTLELPESPHRPHALLLAALGSAVCTWQRNNRRGSSAGVLVDLDLDATTAVHPVRLPAVHTDALAVPTHGKNLVDDVSRKLDSVPNGGRDYALTRNYPALASRAGAQIIVRDHASAEPNGEYAIDVTITATDAGTKAARVSWADELQGVDELIRLWSVAVHHLTTMAAGATGSSAA
ncbi:hypothetical protein QM797_04140 [Rhodococcus sp. IEGM 1381]|uniref:hypothetical protein n=1 Tax=Rhodococcus sp. IEGM 1381 TaxID=3047085 RepID=UPI0024B73B2C|nr:hypothetical protein [Rhodococcus sp. IEGM 1381]MDI9893905.1 hypothetical protein [Rhodococcus sp. IEGM 1381]